MAFTACGGGGGGGNGGITDNSCSAPATTTDRYLASSYDSCGLSNSNLTGIWMIVSDYGIIRSDRELDQQQRIIMSVSDNGNGTLNAFVCNRNSANRNYTFNASANELVILDEVAGTNLSLTISNNLQMQGAHINSPDATVQSSAATAIKIKDPGGASLGSTDVSYELNGEQFSATNLGVSCFRQYRGSTTFTNAPITLNGESLSYFTNINRNGGTEELKVALFVAVNNTDTELSLTFADGADIEGEDPGHTTYNYQLNSNTGIKLSSSVIDDVNNANTGSINLDIDW
jgi:hypothetical protein